MDLRHGADRRPPSHLHATWLRIQLVIDRSDVLHIARLARLELEDAEVERMTGELSSVLDHIAKIGELDLETVEGTSRVISVENVLRADEPRPGLARERALEDAPEVSRDSFRVPAPGD